jgi:hypothetical protein
MNNKGEKGMTKALVLRTCRSDMTSTHGFVWPEAGGVATAPDWESSHECGNGLHGWLYGQGDYSCSNFLDETSKWLVVEIDLKEAVMLGGKCKFRSGAVKFAGDKKSATDYLIANEPQAAGVAVIGATLAVGDNQAATVGALGTATAGYSGTATAGYRGTATAGYSGTATAGDSGTATAGYRGTATAGYRGTATAGDSGTATAGYSGTATAGYSGTATAGYRGTATAGYSGTATAGYSGTATAGYRGTATAGELGEIRIKYWDAKSDRYRTKIGYIGEDGLLANVAYRLNDNLKFEAVAETADAEL